MIKSNPFKITLYNLALYPSLYNYINITNFSHSIYKDHFFPFHLPTLQLENKKL